jgi:hypothetical protein
MAAPTHLAATTKRLCITHDYELALWTAKAKYDLTPFVEDGDFKDRENQELQAREKELEKWATLWKSGYHPLQVQRARIKAITQSIRLVKQAVKSRDREVRDEYHGKLYGFSCLDVLLTGPRSDRTCLNRDPRSEFAIGGVSKGYRKPLRYDRRKQPGRVYRNRYILERNGHDLPRAEREDLGF